MANAGTIEVVLSGDLAGLDKALARGEQRLKSFQQSTRRMGMALSLNVTAPLVLAGGASIKMATDFDVSMTKIQTLVGISRDQVDEWRQSLLELGPAIGRSPQELADALFVVTSAGARGAQALEIVELAGKSAALGLGETATVARAVTAAVTAYGPETLNAARATDILVATIREGNLEASELAGVLGRVLGIAAQVGVSFNEVGGFIATFTRLGVNAAESVTALRSILNTILAPTDGARKALAQYGLTADELRRKVREDGLTDSLIELLQTIGDNDDALAEIIPNVRALGGVLGVATTQAESYREISDNIADSTGILDEAFQDLGERPAFTFAQLKAQISALSVTVGDSLARSLSEAIRAGKPLLELIVALAQRFADAKESTQQGIFAFAALAAIAGPLLLVLSQMIGIVAGLTTGVRLLATAVAFLNSGAALGALAALVTPGGILVAGLAALVALFSAIGVSAVKSGIEVAQATAEMRASIAGLNREEVSLRMSRTLNDLNEAKRELAELENQRRVFETGSGQVKVAEVAGTKEARQRVADLNRELDILNERYAEIGQADEELKRQMQAMEDEVKNLETGFQGLNEETDSVAEAHKRLEEDLRVITGLSELLGGEFDDVAAKTSAYQGALESLLASGVEPTNEELQEFARIVLEGAEAQEAAAKQTERDNELLSAKQRLLRSVMTEEERWAEQKNTINDLREEGLITEAEEARLLQELNPLYREAQQLLEGLKGPMEEYADEVERLNELLAEDLIDQDQHAQLLEEAQGRLSEALGKNEDDFQRLGTTGRAVANTIQTSLTRAALQGENVFRSFADAAIAQLVRVLARVIALRVALSLFGGPVGVGAQFGVDAVGGDALAGFAAFGANAKAGETWIVGERGPEAVTFGKSGQIQPIVGGSMAMAPDPGDGTMTLRLDRSSLPPQPEVMSPDGLAQQDWWRIAIDHLILDRRERGGD